MRSFVVTVAALASTVLTLNANVVIPAEFREIVRESSLIVRGRVTDVRSEMVAGVGIESIATIAVESRMKGDSPSLRLRPRAGRGSGPLQGRDDRVRHIPDRTARGLFPEAGRY